MKRFLILISLVLWASSATAETEFDTSDGIFRSYIRPCNYWRYEFDVNSYTCSNVGFQIEVVEYREYSRAVDLLLQKIEALEARVAELEGR